MKHSCKTFILTSIIFGHLFPVQALPQAVTPAVQGKKTSTKKSTPSSSKKETPVKEEEASNPDADKVASPKSPPLKDKLPIVIALAISIGKQADMDDPINKIKIMLGSAKLLVGVSPNDSRILVADAAALLLERKKEEQSEDEKKKIAKVESELVAIYSRLDPEKSEEFIKESLDAAKENSLKSQANNGSLAAMARAEKMAELATTLIDNGVLEGVDLLLNSIAETGRVANAFLEPFRKAVMEPTLRERMSARIKQAFSGKTIADLNGLANLAIIVRYFMGKDSSTSTIIKVAILELEINSLQQLAMTLRSASEQEQPLPYNSTELAEFCRFFATDLRNSYSKLLPNRLNDVDLFLQSMQELISFNNEEQKQEKATTFEEKLGKASSITDSTKRERKLMNLAFDVLNKRITDYSLDLMIDKILNALNSNDSRTVVKDAKVIADIKEFAKEKNYVQVAQEARRISRDDWRAQVLAGAAGGLDKTDQEAAESLYIKALNVLNDSKPGTAVIRTTLSIAERYYEKNPDMGRQILHSAVRFANRTEFSDNGIRLPFDARLYAQIGSVFMTIGFEPERIQDALRDFNFEKMVKSHWQAMYEAGLNIENKMLRSTFLLKMCEAVINQSSRQLESPTPQ
jgi:hypothetical protein